MVQVFSCEICKFFKNAYFIEHLQMIAPGGIRENEEIWAMLV